MPAFSKDTLIDYLRQRSSHAVTLKVMMKRLGIPHDRRREVRDLLIAMVVEGDLVRAAGGRFRLASPGERRVGRVRKTRGGRAYLEPDGGPGKGDGGRAIVLQSRETEDLLDGDRVAVRVKRRGRKGALEARVLSVLERGKRHIVGTIRHYKKYSRVTSIGERTEERVTVAPDARGASRDGDVVVVEIEGTLRGAGEVIGTVAEVLGRADEPGIDYKILAARHGLPEVFPRDAREEAGRIPAGVTATMRRGREDLRRVPTVTIDGETAMDFDDAVAIAREADGGYRLWVSIADVAHYVKEGSALDREAKRRGTSVYFPGRAIPMLSEELSAGICSLRPGEDRLAMTVELCFDDGGLRRAARFYPSVIRSSERMTYTAVGAILEKGDRETAARYRSLVKSFETMGELAGQLRRRRFADGSLDFDLPEVEITLDEFGFPQDVSRAHRNVAHQIIEEFMLAANRAVAEFLSERGWPTLYRIHEPPDPKDLETLGQLLGSLGYPIDTRKKVTPMMLSAMLNRASGRPEERLVNHAMLRSLRQARYCHTNEGHFGLAFRTYTHFTSPIRRYPDLIVHRVLKEAFIEEGDPSESRERLRARMPLLAEHASRRERAAMVAEREAVDLKRAQFMSKRLGSVHTGRISGLTGVGFYVELDDFFIEGLVHVRSLEDDYYEFDEQHFLLVGRRKKRRFRLGERVKVLVVRANVERREIDFVLLEKLEGG